mgnify:CR=1 FL=1
MADTIADIVTKDAAYLAACIERFRDVGDGTVRMPISAADVILRNMLRVIGTLAESKTITAQPTEQTVTEAMAHLVEWQTRMGIQQEEAMREMKALMASAKAGVPANPLPEPAA